MTRHLTHMISKQRRSIRLVPGRPFLKSKGTFPMHPLLMKAAFIKNPIKLHSAQLSDTVNITLSKWPRGPAQTAGLVVRALSNSRGVTSDLCTDGLVWQPCLTARSLSPFGKMDYSS